MTFEGGCFCGAVRYRFDGVVVAGLCHCTICRRTSGAPALGWVNTRRATFAILGGTPRFARTSPRFRRAFCVDCGTHVWSEPVDPDAWDQVSVHHGTVDRCAAIPLTVHIWFADHLPGFDTSDPHPRHLGDLSPSG